MKTSVDPIAIIIGIAKVNLKGRKRPVIPAELLEQRVSNHMRN